MDRESLKLEIRSNISINLRKLRTAKGLGVRQLGRELEISAQLISLAENGWASPGLTTCAHIAKYFGITVSELTGV